MTSSCRVSSTRRRRPIRASGSRTTTTGRWAGAWCRPARPTKTRSTTAPGNNHDVHRNGAGRPPAPLAFSGCCGLLSPMVSPKNSLDALYGRPGFMLRRAHQIAVALFLEQTGELGITTTQFGILHLLKHSPGLDQITVAKLLGLDRSTTGMVLEKLEKAGLVGRVVGKSDRRKRSLKLTPAGERMLKRLAGPARRAQERVL